MRADIADIARIKIYIANLYDCKLNGSSFSIQNYLPENQTQNTVYLLYELSSKDVWYNGGIILNSEWVSEWVSE